VIFHGSEEAEGAVDIGHVVFERDFTGLADGLQTVSAQTKNGLHSLVAILF